MGSLPKPLIGLLLGTVAFFAVWMVALKPSSSSSSSSSQGGVGQYQGAIAQAHKAVTTSNQTNAKLGAPTATTPASKTTTKATALPKTATKAQDGSTAASKPVSAAVGAATVQAAVQSGKVVAVLFYNDAAADDRAVKAELAAIPTHGGQVVKLAVPVSQLTSYAMITTKVPVNTSPTLVLIDRARQATSLTGYADAVEIAQRIDDALAAK
jgi:hypothetical protein